MPVFWTALVWVVGLVTIVPYGTYYLFFHAARDQYALLITLVLFWIFGFWGVAGPLLVIVKARSVFRAIERAQRPDGVLEVLRGGESEALAIEMIAKENHIPRFLAKRVYRMLLDGLSSRVSSRER